MGLVSFAAPNHHMITSLAFTAPVAKGAGSGKLHNNNDRTRLTHSLVIRIKEHHTDNIKRQRNDGWQKQGLEKNLLTIASV